MKKFILPTRYLYLMFAFLLLSACAGPSPAAEQIKPAADTPSGEVSPSPTVLPTEVPSPSPLPTSVQPTRTSKPRIKIWQVEGCSEARLPDSALLAVWHNGTQANLIFPVDPKTGQPLCNLEPIKAGKQYFTALSPDGKTLAITISNREDGGGARLYLLDLASWQLVETPVEFKRGVGLIAYSPDGRQLAVASFGPTYDSQGMQHGAQLALVDLESQTVSAESILEFNPRLMEYLPDSSALVLYGGSQDVNYLAKGDPTATLLSATDLKEIWKTSLPGILEGIYQDKAIEGPEGQINWVPGVAFSPQTQELFIVHADSERLTKIDFAKKTLGTVEIQRTTSWIERLLALTATVAHAKTLNGTSKTALLSPDGTRLYVAGITGHATQDSKGDWQFEEELHGLEVVDPASGAEIARLEANSSDLALSQDGQQLYLRGWDSSAPWTEVVEAESLKPIDTLKGRYLVAARMLNGDPVLLSNVSNEHQTSLSVVDKTTLAEVAHYRVWGYANWLPLK